MKKLKLYLIAPVIILAVMYGLGWLRLKLPNPLMWGDKTIIFLIASGVLVYLSVLRIEITFKSDMKRLMEGVFAIVFIVVGFWVLLLYYLFTPRI